MSKSTQPSTNKAKGRLYNGNAAQVAVTLANGQQIALGGRSTLYDVARADFADELPQGVQFLPN